MKFLSLLPLIAAALALSLLLVSPPPVEARWTYGHQYQGRAYDRGDNRADYNHGSGHQPNRRLSQSSHDSASKHIYGSRRDPVTGHWSPYR